jgi:hypothetical protein
MTRSRLPLDGPDDPAARYSRGRWLRRRNARRPAPVCATARRPERCRPPAPGAALPLAFAGLNPLPPGWSPRDKSHAGAGAQATVSSSGDRPAPPCGVSVCYEAVLLDAAS